MTFKDKVSKILNNYIFEKFIIILILLNLLVFVLDSLQGFHRQFNEFIKNFEFISIIIFTIEYFLRLFVLKNLKDVFKPIMLIDFFAIAPYYLAFCSINTVFLRIVRLSRLFRIVKIGRYSQAMSNIINAFKSKKEELIITCSIFCIGVLLVSILMYLAEYDSQPEIFSSIPKCFYFAIITFTSVGYGDIIPITLFGKIVCSITAILGIGIHGLFIGVVGSAFVHAFNIKTDKGE